MQIAQLEQVTRRYRWLPVIALFVLLASIVVKSAWLGDDAYIGFRSIDNLLNGHGLRWNIEERVQVFTDPLKLLLMAVFYGITHEMFITAIVFCIVASLGAVFVLVRHLSVSIPAAMASLVALVSSKAFIDYSTSGLENPLNYLLIALFCVPLFRQPITRRSVRMMILLYALVGFNRLDLLLMLFPAMAYAVWTAYRARTLTLRMLLLDGFVFSAPLWGWILFSLIYFGYALPNTYYAKLYTGIATRHHIVQGLMFYVSMINFDPVTLLLLFVAIVVAFFTRDMRLKVVAIGLILYLLYVVKIGGDFMAGRFLSVPYFYAVILLAQIPFRARVWAMLGVIWLGAGLQAPLPTLGYNEYYNGLIAGQKPPRPRREPVTDHRGIADERGHYYPFAGLLPVLTRENAHPPYGWAHVGQEARRKKVDLVLFGTPGFYSYYAGPGVHIIDYYGLGDPLISRLPIFDRENWQVGHYARSIPTGYIESIQTGTNQIADPKVREIYRAAKILAKDPIWSAERFKEILKANTGAYKKTIRALVGTEFGPPPFNRGFHGSAPVVLEKRGTKQSDVYQYGTVVGFAQFGSSERYRKEGWSATEPSMTWTNGPLAALEFPVAPTPHALNLEINMYGFCMPPMLNSQAVDVVVNGHKIGSWDVTDRRTYAMQIPAGVAAESRVLRVELHIPRAFAPATDPKVGDTRQLGVACYELTISELAPKE